MIDYSKIADAVDYYVGLGYQYIEVPWLASKETIDITKPDWCRSFDTYLGSLVASGEQSFLEIRDKLERNKRYVCVTPCFRDETTINYLTQNWFCKVELMHVNPDSWDSILGAHIGEFKLNALGQVIDDAAKFFKRYSYNIKRVFNGLLGTEIDLEVNGIEVGSYGYREYNGFRWVYGTGCAEPRLSVALNN